MAFNPIQRIRSRFSREKTDVGVAVAEETEALQLEAEEEQEEAAVTSEVGVFKGGLIAESNIIRQLVTLHNEKFTLVKGFMATSAMNAKLSNAKKRLFSNLIQGGRRIRTILSSGAARGTLAVQGAVLGVSPTAQQQTARIRGELQLWLQEQQKELQMLSNEAALQIKENEQRLAEVNPAMAQNTKIRDKLREYAGILGRQNVVLGSIKGNLLKKIRAERRELELARGGLEAELAALREQRMAGAGR